MTTLLMILFFYTNGSPRPNSTSQTMQFESMKACENAKLALTESVTQFKHLEQFHIGCYKNKE
jgi:hypothetical protein